MKETFRYMNSKFNKMQERGWTIIPWEIGQPNQAQVLNWCRINGTGEFYYVCESNKINNWCIVIKDPTDATMFKQHFGVE